MLTAVVILTTYLLLTVPTQTACSRLSIMYTLYHFVSCMNLEADLGMFSMFGRTGAPTKKGPPQEEMSDNLNNFVALKSSYSTPSVLCAYNYVMRVLNKMSMMTHFHCVCRVNSVGRYSYIREGPPHFFPNRALLRLNPALYELLSGNTAR